MLQFLGYERPDGSAGVRNHLLVLSVAGLTGPAARRVARALPGSLLVTMPFGPMVTGRPVLICIAFPWS